MEQKKACVILDTNFLLVPEQYRIDIFSEIENVLHKPYELFIIDETMSELERLTKEGKVVDRVAANVAIQLVEKKGIKKIDSTELKGEIVDDFIVDVSGKDTFVCTNDKGLKRRLMRKGVRIIEMIKKSHLRLKKY